MSTGVKAVWSLPMMKRCEKNGSYKDHGKNFDSIYQQHPPGFRWVHDSFGTNWRMMEMQAVIGRIQLKECQNGPGSELNMLKKF